jgi:wobble nucleotide-excising tRNase
MLQSIKTDVAFRGLSATPFTGTTPCVLGKRTVIYGRNGSGKTTLSEVLRLAPSGRADSSTVKARVVTDGSVSTIDLGPTTLVTNRFSNDGSLCLLPSA